LTFYTDLFHWNIVIFEFVILNSKYYGDLCCGDSFRLQGEDMF